MKDGQYVVKKLEEGRRKGEVKVFLKGVPGTDTLWSINPNLKKGLTVVVKGRKISSIKND